MNWNFFKYQSSLSQWCNYYHWIPEDFKEIFPIEWDLSQTEMLKEYEEFDTLCHCTTFEKTAAILEHGFKPQRVSDKSVANRNLQLFGYEGQGKPVLEIQLKKHPIEDVPVIWYGPTKREDLINIGNTVDKYGNVCFSMKKLDGFEGLIQTRPDLGSLNMYFIEVIEYVKQTATRILVTTNDYPLLRKYDPTIIGGPLYFDKEKKKFYHLKKIRSLHGEIKENGNCVEILKDLNWRGLDWIEEKYNKNHWISFSHCDWLRKGAEASSLQCCKRTVWPNGHDEDTLQNSSLFLRNTLKLAFMIWKLEKHLDTYVLIPFDDTTALERVFHDLHREALEKHKIKMANNAKATVPSLISSYIEDDGLQFYEKPWLTREGDGRAMSSLIEDDFLQFYEYMIGFIPQDQWKSMNETIWSEIQVLFKPYFRKRRKRKRKNH